MRWKSVFRYTDSEWSIATFPSAIVMNLSLVQSNSEVSLLPVLKECRHIWLGKMKESKTNQSLLIIQKRHSFGILDKCDRSLYYKKMPSGNHTYESKHLLK